MTIIIIIIIIIIILTVLKRRSRKVKMKKKLVELDSERENWELFCNIIFLLVDLNKPIQYRYS